MRKLLCLLTALLLLALCAMPAGAVTAATHIQSHTIVASDGSCTVTVNVTVHLDTAVADLVYPIPSGAREVTLNGSAARTRRVGGETVIDLSKIIGSTAGDYTFSVGYSLANTVSRNDLGQLEMNLPILSGFAFPVQQLDFTVTLPGAPENKPAFSSGYHNTSIESSISVTQTGNAIQAGVTQTLKDRETLSMKLLVSEQMFPQDPVRVLASGLDTVAMYAFGILALLYWVFCLRCRPVFRTHSATAPDGLTAGHLGCGLTLSGADLTMMVFSWAQLGYILIHLDDNGRVVLHKRMEMGNERSSFENLCYKKLFGGRRQVDGSGYHYAQLCRRVASKCPDIRSLVRRRSGSRRVFWLLCVLSALFCGTVFGRTIAGDAALAVVVVLLVSLLCAAAGWAVLQLPGCLHIRKPEQLAAGIAGCLLWLLMGLAAGNILAALGMVAFLLLMGLAGAYGGRRTENGRQIACQILGFHRYLRTASTGDLQRLQRNNPEYFFSLAPYALAMGLEKTFAKRFGPTRLPGCPWLTTGMDGHMNALEWSQVMRRTADALDARQKRLRFERLLSK